MEGTKHSSTAMSISRIFSDTECFALLYIRVTCSGQLGKVVTREGLKLCHILLGGTEALVGLETSIILLVTTSTYP